MTKKAFTLIEVIVVTALIGILSLVVSQLFSSGNRSYRKGLTAIDQNSKATDVVRDIEATVRGATEIDSAGVQSLTFFTYLRGDQQPAPSKISYYLDSGKLIRTIIAPVPDGQIFIYPTERQETKVVAENVTAFSFSYYNDANQELPQGLQIDAIRMIKASVSIDEDPNAPPAAAEQSTSIQIRNLKTNL